MKTNHVFFIQMDPDIDHIVPIIDALAPRKDCRIMLICVNVLFDVHCDWRLGYIKKTYGIKSQYFYELIPGLHLKYRLVRWFTKLPRKWIRRNKRSFWLKWYKTLVVTKKSMLALIDVLKPNSMTFDEALPEGSMIAIKAAATEKGVKTIKLQPSCMLWKNPHAKSLDTCHADYYLAPHLLARDYKTNPNFVRVLGSMRYTDLWQQKMKELMLCHFRMDALPQPKDKLKVLIFGRGTRDFIQNHSTMQRVGALEFTEMIYKKRPRTVMPNRIYLKGYHAYPSACLIQWADVVVAHATSVAMDVLYYNKIFLYPKYIAPHDECLFEKHGACWNLASEDELIQALRDIASNAKKAPYTTANVQNFISEVVCMGKTSQSVVDEHQTFYDALMHNLG